jgi:hypothetical protein
MRIARVFCCAAVALILSAPMVRADEYNKMTYLTFSGPVQVPGAVLAAGTYMFKLADPDSGRRVIQIWDKEGTKLYTTLLTIPDEMTVAKDDPVVLFNETASGEPQAVKSWFYTGERSGYEFVYPKEQAMKIARATHAPVLAQTSPASGTDAAAMSHASIARVDETGNAAAKDKDNAAANDDDRPVSPAPSPASTVAQAPATPAPPAAPQPSANRTESGNTQPAAVARGTDKDSRRTVGTTGKLPQTASEAPFLQLLAGLSFIAALAVRRLRTNAADPRA